MPRPDPVRDFASTAEPGRLKDLVYCSKMEEHVYSRVRYEYDEVNIVKTLYFQFWTATRWTHAAFIGTRFRDGRRAAAPGGPGAEHSRC
jgi:hypothetical protein